MSFIPSKLGLRTHLLTQINLALVRVAGEKIYSQFAPLLSDLNYGPFLSNSQITKEVSSSSFWGSSWHWKTTLALWLRLDVCVLGFSSYSCCCILWPPAPSCQWYGQKTVCVVVFMDRTLAPTHGTQSDRTTSVAVWQKQSVICISRISHLRRDK